MSEEIRNLIKKELLSILSNNNDKRKLNELINKTVSLEKLLMENNDKCIIDSHCKYDNEIGKCNYGVCLKPKGADVDSLIAEINKETPENTDFSNKDLRNIDLSGAEIKDFIFYKADLSGAKFDNLNFDNVEFRKANLIDSVFTNSKFNNVNFQYANIDYSKFVNVEHNITDFSNNAIKNTQFTNNKFTDSNFSNSMLENTKFYDCNMIKTVFNYSSAKYVEFNKCKFIAEYAQKSEFFKLALISLNLLMLNLLIQCLHNLQ